MHSFNHCLRYVVIIIMHLYFRYGRLVLNLYTNLTWRCDHHINWLIKMTAPTEGNSQAALTTTADEVVALREKLELMQQIHALQLQLNAGASGGPSRIQPAMSVKVPEGSYNMSPTEFRTYKKDCSTSNTHWSS